MSADSDKSQDARKFAELMRLASLQGDAEDVHIKMDALMCEKLRELGYDEAIDLFEMTEKWYG